jgi:uncharacterized membrane protein YdcZ (DUF606 family)
MAFFFVWIGMASATNWDVGCASILFGIFVIGTLAKTVQERSTPNIPWLTLFGGLVPMVASFALARRAGYRWVRTIHDDDAQT